MVTISVFLISPAGTPTHSAITLSMALDEGDAQVAGLVAAQWSADSRLWRRVAMSVDPTSGDASVALSSTGTLALVSPDGSPEAPIGPAVDAALGGVALAALAADATAVLLPTPAVLFTHSSATTHVLARMQEGTVVPSGTRIRIARAARTSLAT